MNPRASDRVRGFQDTNIVVGDIRRISVILGAVSGAEVVTILLCSIHIEYTNLVPW